MKLEELVADGWRRHADEPQRVRDALVSAVDLVTDDGQLYAFSRLLTHLYAEHLDDPIAGVPVLDVLRARFESDVRGYRVVTTGIGMLRFTAGDENALAQLSREECVSALATAASALAWRARHTSAVAAYQRALDEASTGLPDGSPALRALAVGGNNVAVVLERKVDRDEDENSAMVQIADAALETWKRAGGWLEEQRALYRCARSRLQAGRPLEAIQCAQRCLHTCEQNDAPAFERFFACAVVALAFRAAGELVQFERWRGLARARYDALAPHEREFCEDELAELNDCDSGIVPG
jgi:hypothetical protein